jgi:phage recombination protein Bet
MTVATTQNSQIQAEDSKKDLIKRTFFKGATDDEFELFQAICKRTGLDAIMKQVYPVKRWSQKDNRYTMTVQTSIDGFRLIAERTGNYSPGREASYQYDENKKVVSATSYVKKRTSDGTWHEVAATAYFEEYVQKDKQGNPTQFWTNMPHVMLAKCAEALALRKSFPAEMSGIYTSDEMSQADNEPQAAPIDIPITEQQCAEIDLYLMKITDKEYLDQLDTYLSKTMNVSSIYDIKSKDFNKIIKSLQKRAACMEVIDGSQGVA